MATRQTETEDQLLTIEEYANLPEEDGYMYELVRGRLVLVRDQYPKYEHGRVQTNIAAALHAHVKQHGLGAVVVESGYILATDPGTVRGPDVSFLTEGRIPPEDLEQPWPHYSPDLAVEVISPSNTATEMQEKVAEYLDTGAHLVWLVYPSKRTITVYRSREDIRILSEDDVLEGDDVLPGFRLPVAEVFAR